MQRLLDIENAVEQSRNRLEVAKLRGRTLGVDLEKALLNESSVLLYPIRSPIAGKILHSDLAEGKFVEAFEHLFEIVNSDQVWVRLQLLEKDVFNAKIGNRVGIEFPGVSVVADGGIDRLDAALDPQSQVRSAWVTLKDPKVIPGLVGNAVIYTSEQDRILAIPRRSITAMVYKTTFLSKKLQHEHPPSIERRLSELANDTWSKRLIMNRQSNYCKATYFLEIVSL